MLGAHILAGDGIGRYSTSTLPDATAHPDGSLELLAGGSALGTVEWHATPRLDLYGYYGGEYAKRAFYNNWSTMSLQQDSDLWQSDSRWLRGTEQSCFRMLSPRLLPKTTTAVNVPEAPPTCYGRQPQYPGRNIRLLVPVLSGQPRHVPAGYSVLLRRAAYLAGDRR